MSITPIEGQCGTCKDAARFHSADCPSGPEDGVDCTSRAHAEMMDDQTHGDSNSVAEFEDYGFLNLWRLEHLAEETYRCPNWRDFRGDHGRPPGNVKP